MATDFLNMMTGPAGGAGLANIGFSLINTALQNSANRATARAERAIQAANNQVSASRSQLGIVLRGINNKRLLKNLEAQLDAAKTTAARVGEARQRADLETSIRLAETAGSVAAVSALNGITGAGGIAIQTALALQESRQRTERQTGRQQADDDDASRRGNIVNNAIASLDLQRELPSIDTRHIIADETPLIDVFVQGLVTTRDQLKGLGAAVGLPVPPSGPQVNQNNPLQSRDPSVPQRFERTFQGSFSSNFGLGQV